MLYLKHVYTWIELQCMDLYSPQSESEYICIQCFAKSNIKLYCEVQDYLRRNDFHMVSFPNMHAILRILDSPGTNWMSSMRSIKVEPCSNHI